VRAHGAAAALVLAGCASSADHPASGTASAGAPPAAPAAPAAASPAAASGAPTAPPAPVPPVAPPVAPACAAARARFDQTLAGGGACRADADCACYGVLGLQGAIAVTDRRTAEALAPILDAYTQSLCPAACVQTAVPPTCAPHCVSGRCK
jgi:hypothetical protein